jgi:hypothetical protein
MNAVAAFSPGGLAGQKRAFQQCLGISGLISQREHADTRTYLEPLAVVPYRAPGDRAQQLNGHRTRFLGRARREQDGKCEIAHVCQAGTAIEPSL